MLQTPNPGRLAKADHSPAPQSVLMNPPGSLLGSQNAILSGTGTSYYVPDFESCLSVKSVLSGSAVWEAAGRRFTIHENCYLILNDRQHYTMTIIQPERSRRFAFLSSATKMSRGKLILSKS